MRTTERVLLLVLLMLPALGAAGEREAERLLAEADHLKGRGSGETEAMALCRKALALPDATRDDKVRAFDILYDIRRRKRQRAETVQVLEEMLTTLHGDTEAVRVASSRLFQEYWEWNKMDEGLAQVDAFLKRQMDDKAARADALLWKSRFLQRKQQVDAALAAGQAAIDADPANDERIAGILWHMADVAWGGNKPDETERLLRRLLEPKYFQHRNEWDQLNAQRRYGEALDRLKRYEEAARHYLAMEKDESRADVAQDWCLRAGNSLVAQEKFDEALRTYERVFTKHGTAMNGWFSAQLSIVEVLRRQGKDEEAIRAARIALDASPDRGNIADRVSTIADTLRRIDNHVGRANQAINFQRFGPNGEDGKPGTDDDLKDPLPAFGYPSYPDRERAFDKVRKEAGDDAEASRLRAYTYIYTGKPKQALQHFRDALGRAQSDRFKYIGPELIIVGVRAARGYAGDFEPFVDFVNYGPNGPDGKPGTADDLKDPFAEISK